MDYVQIINSDQEVGTSPFVFTVQLLDGNIDGSFKTFNLVLSAVSDDVSIHTNSSMAAITIIEDGGE